MEKKEVIFALLEGFADWEGAFIASGLNRGIVPDPQRPSKYTVKTLSLTKAPVMSIGGFKVIADYDVNTVPENIAGLILIGSDNWPKPEAETLLPLVEKTLKENKLVAAICGASVFLGMHGFLNNVKHTSNTFDYLKQCAGEKYFGEAGYVNAQALRDGNIITANGTAHLEFCREILYALEAGTAEEIENYYMFYKNGLCAVLENKQ